MSDQINEKFDKMITLNIQSKNSDSEYFDGYREEKLPIHDLEESSVQDKSEVKGFQNQLSLSNEQIHHQA